MPWRSAARSGERMSRVCARPLSCRGESRKRAGARRCGMKRMLRCRQKRGEEWSQYMCCAARALIRRCAMPPTFTPASALPAVHQPPLPLACVVRAADGCVYDVSRQRRVPGEHI